MTESRKALSDQSACAIVADEIRVRGPKDGTEALALSFLDLIAERDRLMAENELREAHAAVARADCANGGPRRYCCPGCYREPGRWHPVNCPHGTARSAYDPITGNECVPMRLVPQAELDRLKVLYAGPASDETEAADA